MTFAVPAIGITPPILPTPPTAPITTPTGPGATSAAGSTGFADMLTGAVDNLGAVQGKADALGVQAATGTLANPHDYLIAATEASLTTQMTVAVRNKALEAFNEIMRMPL